MFDFESLPDGDKDALSGLLVVERPRSARVPAVGRDVVMRILPTPIRIAVVGSRVLALAAVDGRVAASVVGHTPTKLPSDKKV